MFKRLANLIRGVLGRFVTGLEESNPRALLENEKENLSLQVRNFNDGLVHHAALCERLMAQVRKLEGEEKVLETRTRGHLRIGDRSAAAQSALRLQTISRELEENRRQAEEAEQTFRELVKARDVAVQSARAKIEALRRSIDDLQVQESMAELNKMASGLMTGLGDTGDTLARLEQMVEDQRSKAVGLSRVAREAMNTSEIEAEVAEQEAAAESALADFAARDGISLDALSPRESDAAARTMGPAGTETE
jgi:hypothetical protein